MSQEFESKLYMALCRNVGIVLCAVLVGLAATVVEANTDQTTAGIDAETARLARLSLPQEADPGPAPIKILSGSGVAVTTKPAPKAVAAAAPVQLYVEGPEGPRPAETLFNQLGCRACHGPGALYAAKLEESRPKPEAELATWILNPQKIKPGVQMPPFETMMSQNEALEMAKWIKAGNPK